MKTKTILENGPGWIRMHFIFSISKIVFAMFFALYFAGCGYISDLVQSELLEDTKTEIDDRGFIKVSMPRTWGDIEDLHEEANLKIGNRKDEAYLIIISESKEDTDEMTLESYSELMSSAITARLSDAAQTGPDYFYIGKYRAIKRHIEGSVRNMNIVYIHVSVETPGFYHQIIGWSLKSTFEKNKSTIETIISSFQEIGNGSQTNN